jgi:hypothetical protein
MDKEEKETDQQTQEEADEEITEDMDLDIIGKANQAAERLEKANVRLEKNINTMQKLQTEQILGGRARTKEKPVEETDAEYAQKVMANETQEEKPAA